MQANGIAKHRALYSAPAVGMHAAAAALDADRRTDGRNAFYTTRAITYARCALDPSVLFWETEQEKFLRIRTRAHEAKADLQSDLMVA
jgi:hypothetical protein